MPIVEVTLVAGRPRDKKLAMIRAITAAIESTIEAPRETIRVILHEVAPENWAVGGEPKG